MSAALGEDTQKAPNQDSSVCVGDGTTCVECGKVFTHPFYFSTHINSHTSEKAFVVIGQCALCGLVFSDADIFAAHLNSSQTRLENQVAPPQEENVSAKGGSDVKSKVASRVASAMKKQPPEIKLEIIDQEDIKVENHSPQPNEMKPSIQNVTDSNEEARGKRKRKAPQRFEIDTGPQLAPSRVAVAADPEVEAYLLSLKQMGLTVDPEAFSSGAKRRRKTSEGSGGKGRGRKEFILIDDGVSDVLVQQKPSPKYEYLDSDDSFDEEPEILPESGKMTRGQRLQQRLERLSQGKASGTDTKPDIVKLEVTSNPDKNEDQKDTSSAVDIEKQKDTAPQPKSDTNTTAVKRAMPTSAASPAIKKEKPAVAAPYFAGGVGRGSQQLHPRGRGRGALAQPNMGKLNTVRPNHAPPFAGRNNQYRAFSMPNTSSSNIYQPRSAVASNSGPRPLRFPQGQMRERTDTGTSPSLMNPQKSENLEDMKKNSRDNVEMMLQSVGMIAVTSSAMGQSKIFGSEKGNVYPPVKKMEATNVRQPGHPYGGFMSKPFSSLKSLPSQQSGSNRGQARFGAGPRGRLPAHPQPYRSNPAVHLPHGQGFGVGLQRGGGQQFSSGMRGSMRGRGSNFATIGGQVSANTAVRGSMRGRGSNPASRGGLVSANSGMRGRGSNPAARGGPVSTNSMVRGSVRGRGSNPPARGNVNPLRPVASSRGGAGLGSKQMKPAQSSGDVIVIVDDDDLQEVLAGPSGTMSAGGGHARSISSKSPKSSTARGGKGEVTILDVDMDSLNSEIKIIEDKTQELSSPTGSVDLQIIASVEQPPHDEVDNDDDDDEIKRESEDKITDSPKVESEPLQADADIQSTSGIDRIADEVDILPGEDIDGWKVCLAEDSDSNDDAPSPQPSTSKAPASKDLHVSLAGSPEPCVSSQPAKPASEDLALKPSSHQPVSDLSPKVEQNESQPQDDAGCTSMSATEKLEIKQANSESCSEAEHSAVSERICHENQNICNEDIKPITVSDQEFVPHSSNQSPKEVDTKSELPGFAASSFLKDGTEACFEDVLQEFKDKNSPSDTPTDVGVEDCAEGADQSMQTATTANTAAVLTPASDTATEDQKKPSILKCNGDSSVGLLPDDAVVSDETSYNSPVALSLDDAGILDKEISYNCSVSPDDAVLSHQETNYNSSLALSLDAVLLEKETGFIVADIGPAECETAVEQSSLTNTDFETAVEQSSLTNTDFETAVEQSSLTNTDFETAVEQSSLTNTDFETAVEQSSLTNTDFETSPDITLADSGILVADMVPELSYTHTSNGSFSDNAEGDTVVPPLESDLNFVNDSTQSHVINSKSDPETDAGSTSVLAGSSSTSHSCPVTGADCLRDDNNLLDIFTEIEKTCKEMEQTLDSETDKKTVVLTEKVDVNRVVSDLSEDLGIVKEEPDLEEVLKVEINNGVAFSESRSDGAVKESRSGDCRYSDMIYEKEVSDNGNVAGIDEDNNTSEHVKKDVAEDGCRM